MLIYYINLEDLFFCLLAVACFSIVSYLKGFEDCKKRKNNEK